MNPNIRLEDIADDSVDQIIGADHNGVNSGVWMVKNTPWMMWFLDELWAQDPWREAADNLVMAQFLSIRLRSVAMSMGHPVICSRWWGDIAERALAAAGLPYEEWTNADLHRRGFEGGSFFPPRRIDDERFGEPGAAGTVDGAVHLSRRMNNIA